MDDHDARMRAGGSGLARERTHLAWNRSGLAVAVTVVIVLRRLSPLHGDRELLALALIAVGATAWVMGMWIGHHRGMGAGTRPELNPTGGRMMTIGTLALALAAFIAGCL